MLSRRWWSLTAVAAYVYLAAFTWHFEMREAHASDRFGGFQEFRKPGRSARGGASGGGAAEVPYRKIQRTGGGYSLLYGFRNYNNDVLQVAAELDANTVAESIREYGFRSEDFDGLDRWYQKEQKRVLAEAESRFIRGQVEAKSQAELRSKMEWINEQNGRIRRELETTLAGLAKQYRRRRTELYEKSGFRYQKEGVVEADIPGMVARNWRRVRPVAKSFAGIAGKRGYDTEALVGAVTAMVQTAVRYEIPDTKEGTRTIAGVMPPPKTLVLGQGDCDTKTALIGSILLNWPNVKMVGLAIPGHYLMAYHRIPRAGEIYIEYQGIPYVMIESAGPARLRPGKVGDLARDFLRSGRDFRIQPFKS